MGLTEVAFEYVHRVVALFCQHRFSLLSHDILEQPGIIYLEVLVDNWVIYHPWKLLVVRGRIGHCWVVNWGLLLGIRDWLGYLNTVHFVDILLQPLVLAVLLNVLYYLPLAQKQLVDI